MAQPPKQGIPPAPPNLTTHQDPNAGRNIHGQPNHPDQSEADKAARDAEDRALAAKNQQPQPGQVNIHGQPPKAHMAPEAKPPSGLGDNTRAEMEAGKANLQQYSKRNDAEHEAGRHAIEQRSQRESQK